LGNHVQFDAPVEDLLECLMNAPKYKNPRQGVMSQIITATFQDGVLKPDEALRPGTRVRLIVESLHASAEAKNPASISLEINCMNGVDTNVLSILWIGRGCPSDQLAARKSANSSFTAA
jgi:predicted DNA-binding antitoxin AbrB/MazE fold protein